MKQKLIVLSVFILYSLTGWAEQQNLHVNTPPVTNSYPASSVVHVENNRSALEQFVALYNRAPESEKTEGNRLRVEGGKPDDLYLASGSIGGDEPLLARSAYHIDINNDGQLEWVLTYEEGDINASGIAAVYVVKNNQLKLLPFDKLITTTFGISGGMAGWYLFLGKPPFAYDQGKIIINYYDAYPHPKVCSYLWESNTIRLVHGEGCAS